MVKVFAAAYARKTDNLTNMLDVFMRDFFETSLLVQDKGGYKKRKYKKNRRRVAVPSYFNHLSSQGDTGGASGYGASWSQINNSQMNNSQRTSQ